MNATSCKICHGDPPRPIWDSYPFWPGVHGSDHDRLKIKKFGIKSKLNQDLDHVFINSSEYKRTEKFIATQAKSGRYAHLIGLKKMNYSKLADLNKTLSDGLVQARSREVAAKLLDHPGFAKYRKFFFSYFNYLDREYFITRGALENAFGKERGNKLYNDVQAILEKRKAEIERYQADLVARFEAQAPDAMHLFEDRNFLNHDSQAWAVLEAMGDELGIPKGFWESGRQLPTVGRYQGGGFLSFRETWETMVNELTQRDPSFAKYVDFEEKEGRLVPILREKAFERLAGPSYVIPPGKLDFEYSPGKPHVAQIRQVHAQIKHVISSCTRAARDMVTDALRKRR
jgi:hypothetical protein